MSKHTPGPWEFIDATKDASMKFAAKCVIRSGVKQIAAFSWNDNSPFYPTKHESQANARMIAAAPDMLAALKKIDASWTESVPAGPDGDRSWAGGLGRLCDETVDLWREIRAAIAKAEG